MSDEPRIPDYLLAQRRERESEIDRSALCECVDPKNFKASESCTACGGTGLAPSDSEQELTPDEIRALGYEPIPPGHPALENEQWSPTFGAGNRKT